MKSNSKSRVSRSGTSPQEGTWTEVMAILAKVEKDSGYANVDSLSQRLLEWIFVNSSEEDLFIQTIVMTSGVASPATIYKSLAVLEREGLISLTVDQDDQRRRIVKPTSRAEALFASLSKELKAALKRHGL